MTLREVLALLRRECDIPGGQAAWAKAHGVSSAYVSDVLNERREPGKGILDGLGLEKRTTYEPKVSRNTSTKPRPRKSKGLPK